MASVEESIGFLLWIYLGGIAGIILLVGGVIGYIIGKL